jgi:hypothetical protein
MRGAIPPLPQYAFVAPSSVKAQGQLYLNTHVTFEEYVCPLRNRNRIKNLMD